MNTDLTDRNYGRQSHLIINSKYGLTTSEIDMILTLLTAIDKEDIDFKDYIFTLSDFNSKTNKNITTKDLNRTIKSLMSKPIEIEISPKGWKVFNWFSYFKFDNGIITCRFDKELKPYFLDIKERFVLSDLRMLLAMKSTYSKRIYLLLKEYSKIGKRTFKIENLQEILKVSKSMRRYDNFKRQALKRAEVDINKFTDLEVKLSEKKRGRKVIEITYTIGKNTTDLKSFIKIIRELYTNELLFYTKDNRPIKCNNNGLLYYDDENPNINKKESQKLWEYLHENREDLCIFKVSLDYMQKKLYLSSMTAFQSHIKENFANKEIISLKDNDSNDGFLLSIFPNGMLYRLDGIALDENQKDKIWVFLFKLAKNDKLKILRNGSESLGVGDD